MVLAKMGLEDHKPTILMVLLEISYAGIILITKASFSQGMSPRVFVVYRQAIAALILAPVAYFKARRDASKRSLGWKNFWLINLISLIGVTINQNLNFEGLHLVSSSVASAMGNLLPAITFVMAYIVGMEKINIQSLRSIAKITGTIICVTGAISIALLRGPKLLNMGFPFQPTHSRFSKGGETWLIGCSFLFAGNCCWSIWQILQVPVSKSYPDHLSLTAWMCFMATLQSSIFTFFIEKDLEAWKLHSLLDLGCVSFAAGGSAIAFFAQSWCISKRGPLFCAMFNPLGTVTVAILACAFTHEKMYLGSLVGAIAVIFGIYVVLWGKATDNVESDEKPEEQYQTIPINESSDLTSCRIDLEEPLLPNKLMNERLER